MNREPGIATRESRTQTHAEIRFGGYGGQGIALMGMLLGKAAAIYDKKESVFTQSYGPESRGGASSADVVLNDKSVDFPLVIRPDYLVVMFQEAYERYRPGLRSRGSLFIDSDLVHPHPGDKNFYALPATRLAEELGKVMVANVVMLGYFVGVTHLVSREAAEKSIASTVKAKFVDLNLQAFKKGYEWAQANILLKT